MMSYRMLEVGTTSSSDESPVLPVPYDVPPRWLLAAVPTPLLWTALTYHQLTRSRLQLVDDDAPRVCLAEFADVSGAASAAALVSPRDSCCGKCNSPKNFHPVESKSNERCGKSHLNDTQEWLNVLP
jgi:hypothetical protein